MTFWIILAGLVVAIIAFHVYEKRQNKKYRKLFNEASDLLDNMDMLLGRFDPEHSAKRRQAANTLDDKEYRESIERRTNNGE